MHNKQDQRTKQYCYKLLKKNYSKVYVLQVAEFCIYPLVQQSDGFLTNTLMGFQTPRT